MPDNSVTPDLYKWGAIRHDYAGGDLLVGNGASRAVWQDFSYSSLYARAQDGSLEHSLSTSDAIVFDEFQGNFEAVLRALWTASLVCQALGQDPSVILARYQHIQQSLIEVVHNVHVPFRFLSDLTLDTINEALSFHRKVYSTNYDLLIYWAIMRNSDRFVDYFWSADNSFNLVNTEIYRSDATQILYLHGALHLVRLLSGKTMKRTNTDYANLLELFGIPVESGSSPLFISEGSAQDKLTAIQNSQYLSFAYSKFVSHGDSMTIFGHGLDPVADNHLIEPLRRKPPIHLAISIYRRKPSQVIRRKAELRELFDRDDIIFFDAQTHPLGHPDLVTSKQT